MVISLISTIDMQFDLGKIIPIEYRDGIEITSIKQQSIAPANMTAINPLFDVTPARTGRCDCHGKKSGRSARY